MPIGPVRSAAFVVDRRLDDEPGAAVLVDEGGEVGDAGERRIGAPLVGPQRRHRGPDLVEARPADRLGVEQGPLGLVEVPAQHVTGTRDVQQHGGERVPGQVVQLAGDAPPLLGHGLVGEGAAGALELVDQPSLAVHRAARGVHVNRLAIAHGFPADARVGAQHLGDQPRQCDRHQHDRQRTRDRPEVRRRRVHHHHAEEERALQRPVAADGDGDRHDDEQREQLCRQATSAARRRARQERARSGRGRCRCR